MKASQFNKTALFLALALTAGPALAGVSHGGSPLASTDENASLKVGESASADKTVEAPTVQPVNIQPKVGADGALHADPDAQAKLNASANDKGVEQTSGLSVDTNLNQPTPGGTPNAGGRVGLAHGAKDGTAK